MYSFLDRDTLKYIFKTLTWTLAVSESNAVITVTLGDLVQIHIGFIVNTEPNVLFLMYWTTRRMFKKLMRQKYWINE